MFGSTVLWGGFGDTEGIVSLLFTIFSVGSISGPSGQSSVTGDGGGLERAEKLKNFLNLVF